MSRSYHLASDGKGRRGGVVRDPSALVPELPFVMPSREAMASAGRDVLAYFHTFPTYPRSGASTHADWLLPSSAPSFGGRWRQRPLPIITGTHDQAQRIEYAKADIATAANIGIDAFTFNIVAGALLPGSSDFFRWEEHVMAYYDAAEAFSAERSPGFRICPNPTMLGWAGTITATQGADALQPLLVHPAAYTLASRPVVIFYNVDNVNAQWYRDFHARLLNTHGINAALIPSHQAGSPTGGGNIDNYASLFADDIFVALHPWNAPAYTATQSSIYSQWRTWCANNGGVPFMCSVGPRWANDRPEDLKQIETRGLTVLQNSWQSAIDNVDPMVQIVSWSDHLESHNIRPSTGYQYAPYDVTAYYLAWYKTGTAPTITRDAVFYAHRLHLGGAARDTAKQPTAYTVTNGPTLDEVVAHVFLTAGATVTITSGGVDYSETKASGGVYTVTAPMAVSDTPKFKVTRSGVDVVPQFSSAFPTRSTVEWQDLLLRMGSSTRPPVAAVQSSMPQDRD